MKAANDKKQHQADQFVQKNISFEKLEQTINDATHDIVSQQHPEGYWLFELEADCTIPAEYILMMHYLDEINEELQMKLANYLRNKQDDNGGWPLYEGGEYDISCTVKSYYALKLAGDTSEQPHMEKARQLILAHGGAARSNVFTLITLAFFQQVPWRATPMMPVELMLAPKWFPITLAKVSYWSRTVMVPLLILYSYRPKAVNPRNVGISELFTISPDEEQNYFPVRSKLNKAFIILDKIGKKFEKIMAFFLRKPAMKRAKKWMLDRINGDDGLGGIFPAQVNSLMALYAMGYEKDHPLCRQVKRSIDKLIVIKEREAYCQPCLSPVWDTGLAGLALNEVYRGKTELPIKKACDWLVSKQLLDEPGDWQLNRPKLAGGGWPFQFANAYYPDLDDTAVIAVLMAMTEQSKDYQYSMLRAVDWLQGMQSSNGGFAAFDVDNNSYYMNEIPFADHGALLDPPTSDVSARVAMLFAIIERDKDRSALQEVLEYLRREQEPDGSWFGRWGTNYIYGTWSVLMALQYTNQPEDRPRIEKAIQWLKTKQHKDGGWGESNGTYYIPHRKDKDDESNAFHTGLALLGLLTFCKPTEPVIERGIRYLLDCQTQSGQWEPKYFTAPGFPKVFYLKYYGYYKYFPLWALARYRNLIDEQ